MPVLGIDTATLRGSVALCGTARGERSIALRERAWHARDLLEQIDRLLEREGCSPADLRGIGVAVGPGSFTGVRIGMATGKGMAYALGIGLEGLSTLEALARAACAEHPDIAARVCAVLDAGRGEVYVATFARDGDELRRLGPDRSRPPHDLGVDLEGAVALVGNGAGLVTAADPDLGRRATVLDPGPPLAGAIARWAAARIDPRAGFRPGTLTPNYVRPSDAEAPRRRS